jgi:ABC-2 type transport system permease protein
VRFTHVLWLVASREIRETLRRKSFWIVAAVLLVASTAAMVVPTLLDSDGQTTYDVATVDATPTLDEALRAQVAALDAKVDLIRAGSSTEAEQLVTDGDADVALVVGTDARIIVQSGTNDRLVGAVRQAVATQVVTQRLSKAGLTDDEIDSAFALPSLRVQQVDEQRTGRTIAATAATLVLYLLLLTLMVQVANGTAVEKANRISEVLVAVVRPSGLMFGKILGVGAIGIATLGAGIVPVLVKLVIGGDLPSGIGATLAGSSAWFVLGLALYLTIAAALGALVERQEQAGSALAPLTFLLIATFLVAQSGADSALGTVLAYIPLTAPLIVPARIALGASSPVELATSLVLLVVSVVVVGRVGSMVYRRAIVRTGRRLKLRDVLTTNT